jgi:hypothetical protein
VPNLRVPFVNPLTIERGVNELKRMRASIEDGQDLGPPHSDCLMLREREVMLREREIKLEEERLQFERTKWENEIIFRDEALRSQTLHLEMQHNVILSLIEKLDASHSRHEDASTSSLKQLTKKSS